MNDLLKIGEQETWSAGPETPDRFGFSSKQVVECLRTEVYRSFRRRACNLHRLQLLSCSGRREIENVKAKKKKGALPTGVKLPHAVDSVPLAQGTDVRNMDHAGAAVEGAVDLYLLAHKLLCFILIIQLIVHVAGLQYILAGGLYHGSGKG